MSAAHDIYRFWISQQTVPGNIVGDALIGGHLPDREVQGRPWLHARHTEQLAQSERQHQEVLQAHRELIDLPERQHRELFHHDRARGDAGGGQPVATEDPGTGSLPSGT
jgi:hypothetical protein